MKNYVQKGEKIAVKAPEDVAAGEMVIVNDLHGVAITSGQTGDEITIATEGIFDLAKDNQAVSHGLKAYYRADTRKITKDPSHAVVGDHDDNEETPDTSIDVNHHLVGVFVLDAVAAADRAQVKID